MTMAEPLPALSGQQLVELLGVLGSVDSVELKLTVPDENRRSTVAELGMDPLEAQIRQVVFFDTPDLTLSSHGLVLRARRVQRKPGDAIVKLRPVVPDQLPESLRKSPSFGVEVDASPEGFVCSGTMKTEAADAKVKAVLAGDVPTRKLFSKEQRELFTAYAPEGIAIDDLAVMGPVTVFKLKFVPPGTERRFVAELWFYPDGSRVLELSTKCLPADAFATAAESKAMLAQRGIDLSAPQQTKTKSALEFFAAELSASG
jgi:hypothetical protein